MLDPAVAKLLNEDRRYTYDAYVFVFEGLSYAHSVLGMGREVRGGRAADESEEEEQIERHVTGQELCEALRQVALRQFGYMAKTVLNSWGIHSTGDFGNIVFNLIRIEHMRKTEDDRREDFDDVYDFDKVFRQDFEITVPDG